MSSKQRQQWSEGALISIWVARIALAALILSVTANSYVQNTDQIKQNSGIVSYFGFTDSTGILTDSGDVQKGLK